MSNAVRISSFELEVPGQFVRKYVKSDDTTTMTITGVQAKAMYDALATVIQFFGDEEVEDEVVKP